MRERERERERERDVNEQLQLHSIKSNILKFKNILTFNVRFHFPINTFNCIQFTI